MQVHTKSDRSIYALILQTVVRPFKPHLTSPKKIFPEGSPRLSPPTKVKSLAGAVERQHQETGLWLYDLTSPHTTAGDHSKTEADTPQKKLRMYYFAGGGWQSPPSNHHWKFCASLARQRPGLTVTIVSAPLAPHAPAARTFPLLRRFLESALLDAAKAGERIALGGDSSGGNLALCLALDGLLLGKTGEDGDGASALVAVLAVSPAVDLRTMGEMGALARDDPLLTVGGHHSEARAWAGEVDAASPWLSPVLGDIHGLASAGVRVIGVTGGYDILTPSALEFRDSCVAHGVEGAWLHWERQMHCFPLAFSYGLPEAVEAHAWMVEQITRLL